MPIYEYRCKRGHNFDVRQHFSDDPVTECEVCEAPVRRVFHPVAVHFKGSGFYNTDYGTRKRSREMAESKENGKSEAGKSEAGKSEAGKGEAAESASSNGSKADSSSTATKSDSGAKKSESKASARD